MIGALARRFPSCPFTGACGWLVTGREWWQPGPVDGLVPGGVSLRWRARPEILLPGLVAGPETEVMLGFTSAGNQALVWCLGDPQRAVAAYHELLRRGQDATGAIRAGLQHEDPAVREGCCRLLDHLVDTDSMGQLIVMAQDPSPAVRKKAGWFTPGGTIYQRTARGAPR
jgi:hypothetical protein